MVTSSHKWPKNQLDSLYSCVRLHVTAEECKAHDNAFSCGIGCIVIGVHKSHNNRATKINKFLNFWLDVATLSKVGFCFFFSFKFYAYSWHLMGCPTIAACSVLLFFPSCALHLCFVSHWSHLNLLNKKKTARPLHHHTHQCCCQQ